MIRNISKLFLVNLLSLLILSYIAFNKNHEFLLHSLDGAYMMDIVRQQFKYGIFSWFGFTSNIFQSLNNIYFPLNSNLIPGYAISALLNNFEINKTLSYMIFITEIFCVMYIFCKIFKFERIVTVLSAWLFILLSFPYIGVSTIYPIFVLVPHFCTGIAESYIIMILLEHLNNHNKKIRILCSVMLAIVPLHMAIFCPTMIVLILPWLCVFWAATLVELNHNKKQQRNFILLSALSLFIIMCSGFIFYYIGLFRYTAAVFFSKEMLTAKDWSTISLLFSHSKIGVWFFSLGVLGTILEAYRQTGARKKLAIGLLIFITCLLSSGVYTVYFQTMQNMPHFIYFEFSVWPLYAIYATNLLLQFFKLIFVANIKNVNQNLISYILIVFILGGYFILDRRHNYPINTFPYPPATTNIVTHLKNNIALNIGSKFNGRVATFDGLQQNNITWYTLPKFNRYSKVDYHLLDLSYNDIPSLFEYSPFISPVFYGFIKNFLVYPQDEQTRNVIVMRKIDPKILRLLGVRYIITDTAIDTAAKLVEKNSDPQAFLYELSDVNVGQYSPVISTVIGNAKTAMLRMSQTNFDFNKEVILQNNIEGLLTPATESNMHLEHNGVLHITGKSKGQSLLVLPIEFSNCLKIEYADINNQAELIRTNILLSGILFTNEVNIKLKYYTGLINNQSCKMQDIADAKRMGINDKIH